MTGRAIRGRIDEAIEQNIRNPCFRCPECQRQARAVGRRVADFQRLVRFRFDDQARRVLSPLGRFADGEMISFDEETLYELADRDATHR